MTCVVDMKRSDFKLEVEMEGRKGWVGDSKMKMMEMQIRKGGF